MKTIIIATATVLALASTSFAQNVSGSNSESVSGSTSSISQYSKGAKNAASAIGPGLIASGLSCSGSSSIGGAGAGWGFSFGVTKEDKHCNAREDARYIQQITGDGGAAKERLCDTPEIKRAFARAGRPCAGDAVSVRTVSLPSSTRRAGVPVRAAASDAKLEACLKRAAKDSSVSCRVYQ